jgi:hypothetical protein
MTDNVEADLDSIISRLLEGKKTKEYNMLRYFKHYLF